MNNLSPYVGLLLMAFFAGGFAITMLTLAYLLGPKNPTPTKQIPFECGAIPVGNASDQRFNVRYYLVAVLFILFDLEVVLMYPWAVSLLEIGWAGFFQMVAFVLVLTVGLVYVWRKGVFNWAE